MTPAEKRTDAGLWLLHAGATLAGLGVVVSAFAHVVTSASEEQTTLVRLLERIAPWARRALLVGLAVCAAGAAAGATGRGGAAARAWAGFATVAMAAVVALVRWGGVDTSALMALRAESPAATAALAALAAGFAAVALHAGALERARGRPEEAASAGRLAAHVVVAGAWLVGVCDLAGRLRTARAAGADLDAPGTTLVVAGAGLAALLCACAAWTLRCLAQARERYPYAPPPAPGGTTEAPAW